VVLRLGYWDVSGISKQGYYYYILYVFYLLDS